MYFFETISLLVVLIATTTGNKIRQNMTSKDKKRKKTAPFENPELIFLLNFAFDFTIC